MIGAKAIYVGLRKQIFDALDPDAISNIDKEQLKRQLANAVDLLIQRENLGVPRAIREEFVNNLVNELVGLGPLQDLMEDESITDIMINGAENVFIERNGLVERAHIDFIDERQLLEIAKRIATRVGRRVDESTPTCDARLEDGSRVNIVIPPIAIDGTAISIRKFKKQSIDFQKLCEFGAMSVEMAQVLMVAARCRLNVLISGGTGSGKTTIINILNRFYEINSGKILIDNVDIKDYDLLALRQRTAVVLQDYYLGENRSVY